MSLTPPASLPPERKKEYIDLKKRIAIHESNMKRKRLLTFFSRSSSPNLMMKDTETSTSKPASPSTNHDLSARSLHESRLRLKALSKQLQECINKRDSNKTLEDREQQTITGLTNDLTSCVSEIENYEQEMESIQTQLLDLQKLLEV